MNNESSIVLTFNIFRDLIPHSPHPDPYHCDMSFILKNAYIHQDADPEKIKLAEIQFDAMSKTFNT